MLAYRQHQLSSKVIIVSHFTGSLQHASHYFSHRNLWMGSSDRKIVGQKFLQEGNSPEGVTFPSRQLGQKNDSSVALQRPELKSTLQNIFFNLLASLYNSLVLYQVEPFASPVVNFHLIIGYNFNGITGRRLNFLLPHKPTEYIADSLRI